MTVVVTAVLHPKPGRKQELAEAMRRGIEAVHTEDGCELCAIHDAEDGTVVMIEKWTARRFAFRSQQRLRRAPGPRRTVGA